MPVVIVPSPRLPHDREVPQPALRVVPPPERERPVRSVCLYTPSFNASGMGAHMLALAERYVARGIDVTLMYWPAPATEALLCQGERLGATIVRTPHPRHPRYHDTLVSRLRSSSVQLLHVHVGTGREDFGGARAAAEAGVPAIVETLHLPWLLSNRHKRGSLFRSLEEVDRLIAVSEAERATYERIGVPACRFVTVPNGVPPRGPGPGRDVARRALGLDPRQPVLITLGRLAVMKGHRYLVDALPALTERFPDLVALVVGDGHLRQQLADQAESLGVPHALRLLGHRPDARDLLDAADVFVLPSRHEGMPLVLLEAMDAGLPVVATRVIGSAEVVEDGVTGRLVPPEDSGALGEALAEVLADPELRHAYGEAGRRRYLERFTSEHMAAATLAVYAEVLQAAEAEAVARTGGNA